MALSCKPGVGQNIALHASPTARTSAFLISVFPVHSSPFLAIRFQDRVACDMKSGSVFLSFGLQWTARIYL